jgi:hypothetical protein
VLESGNERRGGSRVVLRAELRAGEDKRAQELGSLLSEVLVRAHRVVCEESGALKQMRKEHARLHGFCRLGFVALPGAIPLELE